jgi:hypothetical protein
MICKILLLTGFLMVAIANPATADMYKIGEKGVVYCETLERLSAFAVDVLKSRASGIKADERGCGSLKPSTVVDVVHMTSVDGVSHGLLKSEQAFGGKPVYFISNSSLDKVSNSPIVNNDFAEQFKTISPSDVRATPSKWVGRNLEFKNVSVYWVEDDDVRFVTTDLLTLFAKKVQGSTADIEYLKNNCETLREVVSGKCRVSVKFNYTEHDTDNPTSSSNRTVLTASEVFVTRRARK